MCPLLSINFFRYQKFYGKQKGSSTKIFVSVLWDKNFWQNRDAWKFSIKEFFWNIKVFSKCSPMKYFGTVRQKLFNGNSWYPLPLIHKIFSFQKFSKTQNGSLAKFFRSCEKKRLFDKTVKPPPPLLERFRYQNSFEAQKGSSTNFIGTVRQKFFNGV